MKKILTSLCICLMLVPLKLSAQENSAQELYHSPFQFTFMAPPLSTNGLRNSKTVNRTSLNLFIGNSGAVDGFELGSFINTDNYYMNGFQGAGFLNVVGGPVTGVQLAGFGNVSGGITHGAQLSGFFNVAVSETSPYIGDIPYYEIGPNWAFFNRTGGYNDINVKVWIGITAGIRL